MIKLIRRAVTGVSIILSMIGTIGIPLIAISVFGIALFGPSQGHEISQILTDRSPDPNGSFTARSASELHFLWLLSALSWFGIMLWNWSRLRLDMAFPNWRRPRQSEDIGQSTSKPTRHSSSQLPVLKKLRFSDLGTVDGDRFTQILVAAIPRILGFMPFALMGTHILVHGQSTFWAAKNLMAYSVIVSGFALLLVLIWRIKWLELEIPRRIILCGGFLALIALPVSLIAPSFAIISGTLPHDTSIIIGLATFIGLAALSPWILKTPINQTDWSSSAYQPPTVEQIRTHNPFLKHLAIPLKLSVQNSYFVVGQFLLLTVFLAVLIGLAPVNMGQALGPAAIVALGLAGLLPFFSIIAAVSSHYLKWPFTFSVIVLLIVIGLFQSNVMTRIPSCATELNCTRYAIRSLDWTPFGFGAHDLTKDLAIHVTAADRPSLPTAVSEWLDIRKEREWDESADDPVPVIFVASSGGGQKAAFWTARVLGRAHEETGGVFSDHVLGISAVSGGALGATVHTALIAANPRTSTENSFQLIGEQIIDEDGIGPAFASMIFGDIYSNFAPVAWSLDRASTLEKVWERGWKKTEFGDQPTCSPVGPDRYPESADNRSLYDLHADCDCKAGSLLSQNFLCIWNQKTIEHRHTQKIASQGNPFRVWRPILLLNGTVQATGQQIVTSNMILPSDWPISDFYDLSSARTNDCENFYFTRDDTTSETDCATLEVRASTAVMNSARFPYISPGGIIVRPDKKAMSRVAGRILDGGYVDNSGAQTLRIFARDALEELEKSVPPASRSFRPVFIEIVNQAGFQSRNCDPEDMNCTLANKPSPFCEIDSPHHDQSSTECRNNAALRWEPWQQVAGPLIGLFGVYTDNGDRAARELHALTHDFASGQDALSRIRKSDIFAKSTDPIYLQFAMCASAESDGVLGWTHARKTLEIYQTSWLDPDNGGNLGQSDQEHSSDEIQSDLNACRRQNIRNMKRLNELLPCNPQNRTDPRQKCQIQ